MGDGVGPGLAQRGEAGDIGEIWGDMGEIWETAWDQASLNAVIHDRAHPHPQPNPNPIPNPSPSPNPSSNPNPSPSPSPNPDPDPNPNPSPDPKPSPSQVIHDRADGRRQPKGFDGFKDEG